MRLEEFRMEIRRLKDDEKNQGRAIIRFATVREFRSFRYRIRVEDNFDRDRRHMVFTLRGVRAPLNLMPDSGAGVAELLLSGLEGEYQVTVVGARNSIDFRITVDQSGARLTEPPPEGSLTVVTDMDR